MLNRPKYYNLFLITVRCTCGEEYVYPDVQLAREIPKGEAWSPPKATDLVWDIPIRKKEVTHSVLFCSMCADRVERAELPALREPNLSGNSNLVPLNGGKAPPTAVEAEAMLRTLGLL